MAKILAVSHTLTYPPESGVTRRTFHLLEQLVRRHDTTVVSLGTRAEEAKIRAYFGQRCPSVIFLDRSAPRWVNLLKRIRLILLRKSLLQISLTRALQRVLDEVLSQERFDAVFLSSPSFAYYRIPAGAPCIIDAHNVEHDLFRRLFEQSQGIWRRAYYLDQHRMLRRDELATCSRGDVLLTTSERDKSLFQRDLPGQRIHVVPNGVDLDFFTPAISDPRPRSIVFCGMMRYRPNDQGVAFFLDHVFPLIQKEEPEATFTIVGSGASRRIMKRASDKITVAGHVDDIRPYVADAQVFVIPLLVGGGTRLKALEAMAMKRPIVSTTVGCEGIDLRQGESALFADQPEDFAKAVVRLFGDPELRTRLTERAFAVAAAKYSWDTIGVELDGILGSLLPEGRTTPDAQAGVARL